MTIQRMKSDLIFFEVGVQGWDRIKRNNQENIINNPLKQVQPIFVRRVAMAE